MGWKIDKNGISVIKNDYLTEIYVMDWKIVCLDIFFMGK